jgi:small GTP-binding protein
MNKSILEFSEDISNLTCLKFLNITSCRIKQIPYGLVKLNLSFEFRLNQSKDGIHLEGSKLKEMDINLFQQSHEVIKAYYTGMQTKIKECKVIFLGDGGAGKSSIIQRLMYDTFDENKSPTEGIKMLNMPLELEQDEHITLRILDFGGQEIMHAMHRCFLTQRTVYIVVCESRNDSDIDRAAGRWLETIKSFAPDCPVILVLNKCDENPTISVNERNLRVVNKMLSPNIIKASAKRSGSDGNNNGMDKILKEIAHEVKRQVDDFSSSFNKDWLGIKQEVESMARDYISYDEYRAICEKYNVYKKEIQDGILEWLAPLGVAYHYRTESLTSLDNFNVLSPAWLTNGMYRLILRTPEDNGILTHGSIKNILKATHSEDIMPNVSYTQRETEYILHVMRKFEISHDLGNGKELIPLKMKKDAPKSIDSFSTRNALHLSWQAGYIPNTAIHRLMIRKFSELDTNCMWRTGARFVDNINGREALIERTSEHRIDVYVNAPLADECIAYLDDIRKHILNIAKDLNLSCREFIHFTNRDGLSGEVPYSHVLQHYYHENSKIYVEGIGFTQPSEILGKTYTNETIMNERGLYISGNTIENMIVSGNTTLRDMNIGIK